ncbi:VanZ family protein [bacterium]|nr:VanZ family protein [candidate division CSSED10-310 bacterium]
MSADTHEHQAIVDWKRIWEYLSRDLLWLCYVILTFKLSNGTRPGGLVGIPDTVLHFTEFFIMTVLTYRMFDYRIRRLSRALVYYFTLLFSLVYAFLDEIHQFFVPGRCSSLLDIAADSLGILVSLGLIHLWNIVAHGDRQLSGSTSPPGTLEER